MKNEPYRNNFFSSSNYNDDLLIYGFHLISLLVIKSRMKTMLDYGKNHFSVFEYIYRFFVSSRLECFYALTDNGKRMDVIDDRLRGIDFLFLCLY